MYYRDSLIEISCDGTLELDQAMIIKYGQPVTNIKKEDNVFVNGFGQRIIKTDETFTSTWKTGLKNVKCESVVMKWYDDSGKELNHWYVRLVNLNRFDKVMKAEEKEMKKINAKREGRKKKELEGF